MRPLIAATLVLLAAAAPVHAAAQEIAPDSRVRIRLTPQRDVEGYVPPQELRGTLLSMTDDSLTIRIHPATGPLTVARSAVRRIDVSLGVPSRAASAARGAVGGAIVGALVSLQWDDEDGETHFDGENALVGAGAGAVLGAIGGALFPRERWRRVRIPRSVSVAPAPGGGTALGFTIVR